MKKPVHLFASCFRYGLVMSVLAALAIPAWAQDKPDFAALRGADLSADQRTAIGNWLEQEIRLLLTPTQSDQIVSRANTLFFDAKDGLMTHYRAGNTSRGFKLGLAQVLAETFQAQYKSLPSNPAQRNPLGPVFVFVVLRNFDQPAATMEAFQLGLQSPHPATRLAAAEGLWAMRDKATAQQFGPLLNTVKESAVRETSPLVSERLLGALEVSDDNRARQSATALIEIMQQRFGNFENGNATPSLADAQAVIWLSTTARKLNDSAMIKQTTQSAARLLADAVYAYGQHDLTDSQVAEIEALIFQVEEQLNVLVASAGVRKQAPTVAEVVGGERPPGQLRYERMDQVRSELARWIGQGDTQGLLNDAPFNFEVGLGIKFKSESTGG